MMGTCGGGYIREGEFVDARVELRKTLGSVCKPYVTRIFDNDEAKGP